MPKKISDIALAKVPSFANRVSLFQSKLQITRHASGTIVDYSHALYKAVAYVGKLPEELTQEDADGYLSYLLSRQPMPAVSQFKHFIYGLKSYLRAMGFPGLAGLALPKIRREKRLPRVLSVEQVQRLLRSCDLYTKALFSVIYDCGLRAFEACQLQWGNIMFDRRQVFIRRGKGGKDRIVPISTKTLQVLRAYWKKYGQAGLVFMKPELGTPIDNAYIRKCQNKERAVWVEMRKDEVMPGVKYFHVVFTVPHSLHPIAMPHQAMFYDAMFRAAWNTLHTFFTGRGLQGGMTAILHTWGSNLYYHPHIHCIVPGGGIDKDGLWHHLKGCKGAGRDFLFPVQALMVMFRAKLLAMLTARLKELGEAIPQDIRKKCFENPWVVYSRPPAKGVGQVLEYIGRYAYRVAISNSRILDYDQKEGSVTYDYKDYKHGGVHKTMSMSAADFLHLFSLHILPPAFVRIRHYGLLSPSCRDKLRSVQQQLGGTPLPKERRKKTMVSTNRPYEEVCQEQGWEVALQVQDDCCRDHRARKGTATVCQRPHGIRIVSLPAVRQNMIIDGRPS